MKTSNLKILLIKRGAMGDVLMATPLIRQLKLMLNCRIDILIGKLSSEITQDNPYIDQQYILEDNKFKLRGFIHLALYLIKMRGSYEYVFILDKHWYFNLMAKLLGAQTIGFGRDYFSNILLSQAVKYHDVTRYNVLYYLDLLKASRLATPNYNDIKLDLIIKDNDKYIIDKLLIDNNIQNFVVVVNSGGNNGYEKTGIRMLPQTQIIQLLELLLSNEDVVVILLGGTNDDSNYAEYKRVLKQAPRIFNFAGKLKVSESAYLISQADKFYTTDCGAMHMGVAMGIGRKMCAFFGPTNPKHFLSNEYIQNNTAIWSDEPVYDPEYQMRGIKKQIPYFQNLDIKEVLLKY